ncbi:MAG: hypothetical protein FJ123_18725 [Deltaproteobacteria bacterium]|nr:hypothetical protein [Deltaproteobacteria bacterium]
MEQFINRKRRDGRVLRRVIFLIAFLVGGALLVFSFYPALLSAGGKYLAPQGVGKADVVIIEGTEIIKERTVRVGMELISSGRAKRLVVVYHDSDERPMGLPNPYDFFLRQKINDWGLHQDQIRVYIVPKEHPITLNEARIVLSKLVVDKTQKAILLAENFHTRRSYWAYKVVGKTFGVDIISYPYFSGFKIDSWWQNAEGFRNFFGEGIKFLYYVLRGYIPIESLVTT